MKKYYEFLRYIKENNIDSDTPLVVVYRESALSDVQELSLIISGNAAYATNNVDKFEREIQLNVTNVEDLKKLIILSQLDNKDRILTFRSMVIRNEDESLNLTLYLGNTYKTGFHVKEFVFANNKLLVDIAR